MAHCNNADNRNLTPNCREFFNLLQQDGMDVLDTRDEKSFSAAHVLGAKARDRLETYIMRRRPLLLCGDPIAAEKIRGRCLERQKGREVYILSDSFDAFASRYPYMCSKLPEIKKTAMTPGVLPLGASAPAKSAAHPTTDRKRRRLRSPAPTALRVRIRYPNEIMPGLYLGNRRSAVDARVFRDLGITHVVNATKVVPCKFPEKAKYIRVRIGDKPSDDILAHLDDAVAFVHAQLPRAVFPPCPDSPRSSHSVLVHCEQGISRSTTIVCAYLVCVHGLTVDQALRHVRASRPVACPNVGFVKQLERYAKRVAPGGMGKPAGEHNMGKSVSKITVNVQ